MSKTHYEGQVLTDCPDCDRTIKMVSDWHTETDVTPVLCGQCGATFTADRKTGVILEE